MGVAWLDAQTVQATLFLSRCAATVSPLRVERWWQLPEHFAAFPCSSAAMLLLCLAGPHTAGSARWTRAVARTALMLLAMPALCVLALALSGTTATLHGQPVAFAIWMQALGRAFELAVSLGALLPKRAARLWRMQRLKA